MHKSEPGSKENTPLKEQKESPRQSSEVAKVMALFEVKRIFGGIKTDQESSKVDSSSDVPH